MPAPVPSSPSSPHVAGVAINLSNAQEAVAAAVDDAARGSGFTLFTLNLDHVVKLRENPDFVAAYRRASYVTADGWPIAWLGNRGGAALERTTGADLIEPICAQAAERGVGIYFIGPSAQSQERAFAVLRKKYPGLRIAGAEAPMISLPLDASAMDALAARTRASGCNLCFVSLGAPKQELVADALFRRCPDIGFLCVGAGLDFIGGTLKRAPQWTQKVGGEWLWRMASEPRRLTGRYAKCAVAFADLAIRNPGP
ncbi:MAG: WecB/TagA/CpsF family glycosyltransferase [Hyphomicrobiales bacterium]|nr:WecB/TagA/CpsF family glycosyltransferase [Hyphomicrobiales bacterium]